MLPSLWMVAAKDVDEALTDAIHAHRREQEGFRQEFRGIRPEATLAYAISSN